ncbi:MAG: signal peptidase II, partial [Ottowia sp.]|nr:signal peptidase II [Ottowia sp.]
MPSAPAARLPARWWALIALVIVLDQLSKYAVAQRLVPYEAIRLTPFFQLVHVYNTGAAFSMLAEHPAFARIF